MKKSEFKEMINRGTESLSDYEIKEIFHFIGVANGPLNKLMIT